MPEQSPRDAYYGKEIGVVSTPVIGRGDLNGSHRQGPLVIEEYDSTTLVPPNSAARLDEMGNIIVEVNALNPGDAQ
jgi:N-methylhydantoinase A